MTRRDRLMIIAVAVFATLVCFWMFVLKPQRTAASEATSQLESAQQALAAAQAKLTAGRAAQQAFRRDRTTIVKLGRTVPETDDIPTLLTQLQDIAKRENVMFTSYKVSAVTGASASAASSSSTVQQSASGSTSKDTEVDASTQAVAPLYPPGSVEIAGGLGRTPITITLKGGYFELERYLRAVQRFAVLSAKQSETKGRLMIVDGFTYKPTDRVVQTIKLKNGKLVSDKRKTFLEADLGASVYFAPPLNVPSAAAASSALAGSAPTPAASTTSAPTTTGAAAVGGIR